MHRFAPVTRGRGEVGGWRGRTATVAVWADSGVYWGLRGTRGRSGYPALTRLPPASTITHCWQILDQLGPQWWVDGGFVISKIPFPPSQRS